MANSATRSLHSAISRTLWLITFVAVFVWLFFLSFSPVRAQACISETEPNDQRTLATLIAPSACVEGESLNQDEDFFRVKIESEMAKQRWNVDLLHSSGEIFQLCILDAQGEMAQCRSGSNATLNDLILVAGESDFLVQSRRNGGTYSLKFSATGEAGSSDEAEPNDLVATASPIVNSLVVNGRLVGEEDDIYRFEATGSVARFRVEVEGSGVAYLALLDAAGNERVRHADSQESVIALDDLYLEPGAHFFQVHGTDASYSLRLLPLTTAWDEHEPNDDIIQATLLPFGVAVTGRLPNAEDLDQYRFSLSNETHLLITVVPPTSQQLTIDLRGYFFNGEPEDDHSFRYEAFLPAGDYTIQLKARQPSTDPYTILIEHLNPFSIPVDLEPANNNRPTAPTLPPSFVVDGFTGLSSDPEDWYQLPTTEMATWVNVQVQGAPVNLTFYQGEEELRQIKLDRNKGIINGPLPEAPLNEIYVRVNGRGSYHLVFWFDNGPQPLPAGSPPVQIAITLPSDRVAAFADSLQHVEGSLFIQNTTSIEQILDLAVTSSDFAWQPNLEQRQITLAPNESQSLPLNVNIQGQVAEGEVTLYATAANLALDRANTSTTMMAICGIAPTGVNKQPLNAPALTGGINVAWIALGGKPLEDRRDVADLLDGRVSFERGFQTKVGDKPVTIELAGKEPLTIQGVILNPTGQLQPPNTLRNFSVAVSLDGQEYQPILVGKLSPVLKDQPFVFAQPVQARFVRLDLIDSHKAELQSNIGLGEFKVIVTAPSLIVPDGFDLASPELGGHIVWATPALADAQKMLTGLSNDTSLAMQTGMAESDPANASAINSVPAHEWIVGFQQNRAAQIQRIEWNNSPQGTPAQRIAALDLYVSLESPMGPWQLVKNWKLDPRSTGKQQLNFASPLWARYVRFVIAPLAELDTLFYPKSLRILERPSDDSYRSILAEWDENSRAAIYEQQQIIALVDSLALENDALGENNQREHAQPLVSGQPMNGTIFGTDEDWFAVEVLAGFNHLHWEMEGNPVDIQLLDSSGTPVNFTVEKQGGRRTYNADVTPGQYALRIATTPQSVLIAWDTARSLRAYLPAFQKGLAHLTGQANQQNLELNLLPFGLPGALLLPEWSSDPTVLQQALTNYGRSDISNNADVNLQIANKAFLQQTGAPTLVLFSGQLAAPGEQTANLWRTLTEVQPQIFAFALPSASDSATQSRLQDWASINQGRYATVATQDDFEKALDQIACHLQATAAYQLQVDVSRIQATPTPTPSPTLPPQPTATPTVTPQPTVSAVISDSTLAESNTEIPADQAAVLADSQSSMIVTKDFPGTPGLLSVVGTSHDGAFTAPIRNGSVEIILDASGSMMQMLDERYRIDIAREVLSQLVTTVLDPDTPLALRIFGHREPRSCRTDLEIPLAPLDQTNAAGVIAGVMPKNFGMTPIGASLAQVPSDMAETQGSKVIVLVTDGEETCGGNPAAEIQKLIEAKQNIRINIIGFAVNDEATKKMFTEWAQLGQGFYFNATNALELSDAIDKALQAPFRVYTADGQLVTSGVVNGGKIEVPTGQYTVVVETEEEQRFDNVLVIGGKAIQLEVKGEE